MSYPKTEAPYTERGYFDSSNVIFNVVDNGTSVTLSWSNLPFTAGTLPHMVAVGKEYGSVDSPFQTTNADSPRECPTQGMYCIPHPNGQPPANVWDPSRCYSGIWDTPVAFANYNANGHSSITIPYNQFMLAANNCAFQTDGVERQYYVELSQIVGAAAYKTKWVFNYVTPTAPFTACGDGQVPVPPPPPVTEPTNPGKGNEKKK